MQARLDIVFLYLRGNRSGFNALAGALETSGLDGVEVLLAADERSLTETVQSSLDRGHRTIIGLSFFTCQSGYFAGLMARLRGRFSGKALILAGGPHPSGAPDEVLAMGADAVVKGEGEAALTGLARSILAGGRPDGGVIRGPAVAQLDAYPPFSFRWRMFGYIEITRGCPFLCSYCQTPRLFGARQRHRSLENILSLAERMRAEGLSDIRFLSPDAFAYGSGNGRAPAPEKIEALLKGTREAIGAEGNIFFGTFPSEVRPEHVDRDTLGLTRRYAANRRLVIGAQSGSPRMLEAIRRGHTVEDVYRAVGLAIGAGFETDVDFIFGLPGETEADAELTLKTIADLTAMGARIHAHTFMPLPETAFAGEVPSPLSARTEKAIRTICSRGQAFGQWEKQRLISGGRGPTSPAGPISRASPSGPVPRTPAGGSRSVRIRE